jgi:hypothetical protein
VEPPAKSPCGSCPYRRDVPSGVWAAEEYDKLPEYDKETAEQPPAMFACHQGDGRACAGWVATHDMTQNLGLRIGMAFGHVASEDVDAFMEYETATPLFGSGQEAADHGKRDLDNPSERASRVINKVMKTVPGVRQ